MKYVYLIQSLIALEQRLEMQAFAGNYLQKASWTAQSLARGIGVVMLWRLADRREGCQSRPKKISDIVPPQISTHHPYRRLCILEAALSCRAADL